MTVNTGTEREVLLDLIRQWGSETSDAVLDPECHYFFKLDLPGVIGYRLDTGYAVVYGDPICAPENYKTLLTAFEAFCKESHYSSLYLIVSEQVAKWAYEQRLCNVLICFGDKLWINPQHNPLDNSGRHGSLLRRKTKQAIREGTEVVEYVTADPDLESAIAHVGTLWLQSRPRSQLHISNVHLFDDRKGKRWFYAKKDGKIVGVVLLNQLQHKKGWLLNHLMITRESSHGTQELLVIKALESVAKEGCEYVTFGACPNRGLNDILGLNKFIGAFARLGYQIARKFFHLDGFSEFWSKFQPCSERVFIMFDRDNMSLKGIFSLLRALNVMK